MDKKVLLFSLSILSLISFYLALPSFERPPDVCDAEISLLNVSVELNDGQRLESIKVEFPREEPIEVRPDDTIALVAEIKPRPEGCSSPLSVNWRLPFASDSSSIEFISGALRQEVLKVIVIAQVPKDYSEGQITVSVLRILSGTKEQMQNLRFEVKGE